MNEMTVEIELDAQTPDVHDRISGTYRLPPPARRLKSVEISALWVTESTGDTDTAIHHCERRKAEPAGPPLDSATPARFSIPLPEGPHSYEGALIKIRWLVRVTMVDEDGQTWTGQAPFRLGAVAQQPRK
jgi:hypothetical protein